jgi:hypothetical protein
MTSYANEECRDLIKLPIFNQNVIGCGSLQAQNTSKRKNNKQFILDEITALASLSVHLHLSLFDMIFKLDTKFDPWYIYPRCGLPYLTYRAREHNRLRKASQLS